MLQSAGDHIILTLDGNMDMHCSDLAMKDRINMGELEIKYVKTSGMLVDVQTKPLGGEHCHKLTNLILEKITPRKRDNQSADVVISLERLSWSNHETNLRKHKAESQKPCTGNRKLAKK
jgi:hypothetical protein